MVWNDMQWYSFSLPFLLLNDMQGYVLHSHTLPFLLMQWYARICLHSHTLPFLLMQTFWMDTHCMDTYWWDMYWTDTYWWDLYWWDTFAIPADAHLLNGYALTGYASHGYVLVGYVLKEKVLVGYVLVGYVLNGYVCKTCWCKPFEWIRIEWIRTGGIRVERIRIGGIRIGGIRFEWTCVGYVWCDGYMWDMCGVRYANNLLKNPATKRLSGKMRHKKWIPSFRRWRVSFYFFFSVAMFSSNSGREKEEKRLVKHSYFGDSPCHAALPIITVDGRYPAFTSWGFGSLSQYSQGILLPRWCRISSINRMFRT